MINFADRNTEADASQQAGRPDELDEPRPSLPAAPRAYLRAAWRNASLERASSAGDGDHGLEYSTRPALLGRPFRSVGLV